MTKEELMSQIINVTGYTTYCDLINHRYLTCSLSIQNKSTINISAYNKNIIIYLWNNTITITQFTRQFTLRQKSERHLNNNQIIKILNRILNHILKSKLLKC